QTDGTPAPMEFTNTTPGVVKGIGIVQECCPTNNNIAIDTVLCEVEIGQRILLQELINCEGGICEGLWTPDGGNMGVTYDDCDNSVTIDALNACGKFTLSSDGTGPDARCGAFVISINISVNAITTPEIAGTQDVCATDEPTALTISTPSMGADSLAYQWLSSTESDSTGFTPVAGATMDEYTPTTASLMGEDTTWFRLEVTNIDTDCLDGTCADTSNAVFVALFELPEIVLPPNPTICSTQPIDLVTGVSITPDTLGGSWVQSGNGTFLNAAGEEIAAGPFEFGTAVAYLPGSQDIAAGTAMLTLTTDDPDGPCAPVSATLTAMILKVDCGDYPWDGND
ncbi:MAG: hypothetical protein AAF597_17060, partial [Bacteroidota bacterium]